MTNNICINIVYEKLGSNNFSNNKNFSRPWETRIVTPPMGIFWGNIAKKHSWCTSRELEVSNRIYLILYPRISV